MKEFYEVVLSGVAKEDLLALLNILKSHSERVAAVTASQKLDIENRLCLDQKIVTGLCGFDGDVCVTAKLYGFDTISARSDFFVLLRIIKYGKDVNVELCFDDACLIDVDRVMLALQKYLQGISDKIRLAEFYGGMEPARDLETRYFTNDILGPLFARAR
ncbi:hypothetical protein [Pseudomonas sp. R2-60-08W]|uniref:hypothetical protein n=1 Tax=Pseudomonas sp. R2-60-08W TaxID=1173280 RepID=UPI000F57A9A5|nr:hypothetical protein [Pseudomonas sp. R2-60-08W]